MRKALLGFCTICLLLSVPAVAEEQEDDKAEWEAVRQVCLDYFEGWFYGDADRFLSALHPELAKRIPWKNESGKMILRPSDREEMAEYIRSGRTKKSPEEAQIKVKVFDVSHGVATAVGSCSTFFDYMHLAKIDGKWWIVNVLWQVYPREE